ncbi:Two-component system response regulator PmrA, probable fragment [Erwinia pyrifoliae Ep1/96]|nr:Two-component system response regulator PmrA, probable fragment [Erwinia pyrifoliae Ep1/96]
MKIRIVEDDALLPEGLPCSDGGGGESYAVDCAVNAAQGAAFLHSARYSLVVLDLGLPDRDGADLLRQWRKENRICPC